MGTNKMREQFESAWRARYPAHGDVALKRSGLDPEDYCNTRVKDAWWAWQASREAVVVELPDYGSIVMDKPLEMRDGMTADGRVMEQVYQSLHRQCRTAIEAQGLKVAP